MGLSSMSLAKTADPSDPSFQSTLLDPMLPLQWHNRSLPQVQLLQSILSGLMLPSKWQRRSCQVDP